MQMNSLRPRFVLRWPDLTDFIDINRFLPPVSPYSRPDERQLPLRNSLYRSLLIKTLQWVSENEESG